jgi:hypothetical protein
VNRGRGRPAGAARPQADGDLVMFVRARSRGTTVEKACERYRKLRGVRVGTVEYLTKKYERCAHAYPDFPVDDRVLIPGVGPVRRRGRMEPLAGTRALTWPTDKPSKY